MKKTATILAAGALVFAACGGDDDGGGAGSVDDLVTAVETAFAGDEDLEGVELDSNCIRELAEGLSADDRAEITAAINEDRDPEGLSPEASAASVGLIECIDFNIDELLEE